MFPMVLEYCMRNVMVGADCRTICEGLCYQPSDALVPRMRQALALIHVAFSSYRGHYGSDPPDIQCP